MINRIGSVIKNDLYIQVSLRPSRNTEHSCLHGSETLYTGYQVTFCFAHFAEGRLTIEEDCKRYVWFFYNSFFVAIFSSVFNSISALFFHFELYIAYLAYSV